MYNISINEFEGPMDLLLHLIKQSNISIYDISIDEITKQYLDFITNSNLDLNESSEYLVMAVELMEIKSSSLLPKEEIPEDEYEEDKREQLINRLLEYEKYKNIKSEFKELEGIRNEVYTKEPSNLIGFSNEEDIDYGVDINDLVNAMKNVLNIQNLNKPLDTKITNKEYSITKRSNEIKSLLKIKKKVNFIDLFDVYSKDYIVVTFLSILSLTRKEEITIEQDSNFSNIVIRSVS